MMMTFVCMCMFTISGWLHHHTLMAFKPVIDLNPYDGGGEVLL